MCGLTPLGHGIAAHALGIIRPAMNPTNDEVGRWAREAHLIIGEGDPDEGLLAFARAAYAAGRERALAEIAAERAEAGD